MAAIAANTKSYIIAPGDGWVEIVLVLLPRSTSFVCPRTRILILSKWPQARLLRLLV